jgi:NAD(P)-dependent dehydrogenase (short-subunit alcohol dehydrogenase family)
MAANETAVVTGATGAIGEAIASGLAANGLSVVLACRNTAKAERAASRIRDATGNDAIFVEQVDLGSARSVADLRERWHRPLDVLINNAAITPRRRELTDEGLERQFAVNVLGYTRMIDRFADVLSRSSRPRVVNVASYWAGDLDLDDLMFERRRYDNNAAYRQSKQADRMLTAAYADRLAAQGISVNACHPGDVRSNLSTSLGFGGHESAEQAAETPLWLALEPPDKSGRYFAHRREERCRFAEDRSGVEALFATCQSFG